MYLKHETRRTQVSDSIPVDDVKIEMEGAVQLPDDALTTVIAELTAWRNLAHRAYEMLAAIDDPRGFYVDWLGDYARLTRG